MVLNILLLIALAAVFVWLKATGRLKETRNPKSKFDASAYALESSILTFPERTIFSLLKTLEYRGVHIFCKIRLADIFAVKKSRFTPEGQAAFNRIAQKHVDFLLTDNEGKPVAAIEVDDSSHQQPERITRDDLLNELFKHCALPLIRIPWQNGYSARDVHLFVKPHLPPEAYAHFADLSIPKPKPAKPIHIIAQERSAKNQQ